MSLSSTMWTRLVVSAFHWCRDVGDELPATGGRCTTAGRGIASLLDRTLSIGERMGMLDSSTVNGDQRATTT
jgi:hypothetical protein